MSTTMETRPFPHLHATARAALRGWALLAVGALAVAGALALLLALSRTPGVQHWLPWGADFFHKGLVTHVVFSFQVWFLAMLGVLAALCGAGGMAGPAVATAGAALLLVPTLAGWGEPSLNNYVPVLDHPLFLAGLALLAAGVAAGTTLLRPSLAPARFGTATAVVGLWAALACFALALMLIPPDTDRALHLERLFWGGGHVLQFVNTALLMVAWQALAQAAFGRGALPPALARASFAALGLFTLAAPLLYRLDVLGLAHRQAFTQLLWYGLPLPPLVMGLGVAWMLATRRRDWRSPAILSLALSLAVFGLGGGAGFFLGVADTRTPSHYHAVIGGVNLALMGLMHVFALPALGRAARPGRWLTAQFHLYGGGQALHAAGFYIAGLAGVARKTAGADQGLDSGLKLVSMGMVGLGAAVAVLGGVLFVATVLALLLKREDRHG
ncbi:MAG TPA: cytochrome C oxidase subunit I [Candidatus Omnitrophota bacterium]|nr:cytochrome C oxidase subunit I [Candidatus Omnitrophota bacterium]